MQKSKIKILSNLLILTTCYFLLATNIFASNLDDLRAKIEERNKQIEEIEKEIAQYQEELNKNTKEASTLKNQIIRLETTKKKLMTDISLTQKQIESAKLNIEELSLQIELKEKEISDKITVLSEIIKDMKDRESTSLVELVLSQEDFSGFFGDLAKMEDFQKEINVNLAELKNLKENLESEKTEKEKQKNNLEKFKSKLSDQKQLVEINKTNKNKLLQETKNKESNYKKILEEKMKLRDVFAKELDDLESQLRIEIDPRSLPPVGSGVLGWPFTSEKMLTCRTHDDLKNIYCITQYFGNTPFASANPQLYRSGTHNGVDFRAPEGTEILASADGVVRGVGNTDIVCPNASYGKWILIDHKNGLSTVYAHLSLIKVSAGQKVERGQLIGYSGNTGSSTGPHLHFTVYATAGVSITTFPSRICSGRSYTIPVASYNSYLNPLSYL
jgi:murein DD-endopeptidase MepM/ murein hydrolase activator NlpD